MVEFFITVPVAHVPDRPGHAGTDGCVAPGLGVAGAVGAGVLTGLGGAVGQAPGLVLAKYGIGSYDAFASTQIRVSAGLVGFAIAVCGSALLFL